MTEFETSNIAERLRTDYLAYAGGDAINKYRRTTAGQGINFLLPNVYGPLLMEQLLAAKRDAATESVSVLEFGCGAGMALQYLTERLLSDGIEVDRSVGTDLVPGMIDAARADLEEFGTTAAQARTSFIATPNEELVDGIAGGLGLPPADIEGTFALVLGVNTFRYAIRRETADEVVDQLCRLLTAGGRVVMIDMNDRFPYGAKPAFRGFGNGRPLTFGTEDLPSLDAYARPFEEAGLDVVVKTNFSWMPHSANGLRFHAMRAMGPVLDRLARKHAMRSLVVAQKR